MADVQDTPGEGRPAGGDPALLRHLCHELRQPLVVAVGYVSMLEEGSFGDLPAEARAVLRTVAERLDALNAIIDSVLSGSTDTGG